jgi:hypothetical protein
MRLQRFSRILGLIVLSGTLLLAIPPFLVMPLWVDATHYDLAARNWQQGGTPYQDLFDTNLPGMLWGHALVRTLLGPTVLALRLADLIIVGACVLVLDRLCYRAGAAPHARIGLWLACALFYPFQTEFAHVQRDIWMLLPALIGVWLRVAEPELHAVPRWRRLAEGVSWGIAVWIKPHALIPALTVWLASRPWRRGVRAAWGDLGLVLAGGIATGLAGLLLLETRHGCAPLWDVLTRWNPSYVQTTNAELSQRWQQVLYYFTPWSWLLVLALPLACYDFVAGTRGRAILAALLLSWWAQALLLQKGLDYVHVPEVFLAIAILTTRSLPVGLCMLPILALTHEPPYRESAARFSVAVTALRQGITPADRDRLSYFRGVHCSTQWVPLMQVANYLRQVTPPLQDHELIAWNDSTHPLYWVLDLRPGIRFLHVGTAWEIAPRRAEILAEVQAARPRYIVSDLARMTWDRHAPQSGDEPRLPDWFPAAYRDVYPWNQPIVFRAGRYLVHRAATTPERIDIPPWESLGMLSP